MKTLIKAAITLTAIAVAVKVTKFIKIKRAKNKITLSVGDKKITALVYQISDSELQRVVV